LNLLDTPGHQDFSEVTHRALTAVDSTVMALDPAKGIEEQTRKLFEVCSRSAACVGADHHSCQQAGRKARPVRPHLARHRGRSCGKLVRKTVRCTKSGLLYGANRHLP